MSANSTLKRARRIEKRCIGPVVEALRTGKISARSADVFLKLSPASQARELARRLGEAEERERLHAITAQTIRQYLDQLGAKRVDLIELGSVIRERLSSVHPG